jgi:hypothetical protein
VQLSAGVWLSYIDLIHRIWMEIAERHRMHVFYCGRGEFIVVGGVPGTGDGFAPRCSPHSPVRPCELVTRDLWWDMALTTVACRSRAEFARRMAGVAEEMRDAKNALGEAPPEDGGLAGRASLLAKAEVSKARPAALTERTMASSRTVYGAV